MALTIKSPDDYIPIIGTMQLFYGQPGSRKTSFSFTAERPHLFDYEGGIVRVEQKYRGSYSTIRTWEDLMAVEKEDVEPFQTLVHDTAGRMLELCMEFVIRENPKLAYAGQLSPKGWGAVGIAYSAFMRKFRSWGKDQIFIAHEKEEKDGDKTMKRPDIPGQARGMVVKDADLVAYFQTQNGKPVACFTPSEYYFAKNSCSLPPVLQLDKFTAKSILHQYKEKVNSDSKEMILYKEQILAMAASVKSITDVDGLTDFLEAMKTTTFYLSAKREVAALLREKAEQFDYSLTADGLKKNDTSEKSNPNE